MALCKFSNLGDHNECFIATGIGLSLREIRNYLNSQRGQRVRRGKVKEYKVTFSRYSLINLLLAVLAGLFVQMNVSGIRR